MLPSDASLVKVMKRVGDLVEEVLNTRALHYAETGLCRQTIYRAVNRKLPDMKLSTLVKIADALDCDVVVHLRERRPHVPTSDRQ